MNIICTVSNKVECQKNGRRRASALWRQYLLSYCLRSLTLINSAPSRMPTALAESFIVPLFRCLYFHTAIWEGNKSQLIFSASRFRWKESTARRTPSSDLMLSAISFAACKQDSDRHVWRAAVRLPAVRLLWWIGGGPAPAVATMAPQKG